ncbi:heme/hemin ABC transporter substrate-binding protein, partial [Pseudonocardia pini]|uniref:heme/hemin ABC transporter substrate-binding protein n=1 Tax=Pseudonocardia pini TaxID=2758030 RepID=UPI0015EFDE92
MSRPVRRLLAPLAGALALTLAVGACSSSPEAAETAAPAPALPAGWSWVAGTDVATVADAGTQVLPATLTGDDDVSSQVTDTSRTIVGGDDVIEVFDALGRSTDVFAAPEESATETGRNAEQTFLFNASTGTEGVLSLGGTLFVGNSVRRHTALAEQLRGTGAAAVVIDNLQPAPEKIRKLATALGMPAAGEELAIQVEGQYAEAERIAAGITDRPRVLHISATGAGGNPAVGGADTAAANVIRLAGGTNVGDEAGVENYSELSPEGVVQSEPDVILVSENDLATWGGPEQIFALFPTLAQTPAALEDRVIVMPDLQLKGGG